MAARSIRFAVLLARLFIETIVPVNLTSGRKRALPDAFDMKPAFKYYRNLVIYNSAKEKP